MRSAEEGRKTAPETRLARVDFLAGGERTSPGRPITEQKQCNSSTWDVIDDEKRRIGGVFFGKCFFRYLPPFVPPILPHSVSDVIIQERTDPLKPPVRAC